jgi:hypothetical protein
MQDGKRVSTGFMNCMQHLFVHLPWEALVEEEWLAFSPTRRGFLTYNPIA